MSPETLCGFTCVALFIGLPWICAAQSTEEKRSAADKAFEQAEKLNRDRSTEVLRQRQGLYEEALSIWRELEDRKQQAAALSRLGSVFADLGDSKQAMDYDLQALTLSRETGERRTEATTLQNLGILKANQNDFQKALEYYSQALALRRQLEDKRGEAGTLTMMGVTHGRQGELDRALECFEQALPLRRAVGDKAGEGATLHYIGAVYGDRGETERALEYFQQALELRRASGDRRGEAATLVNIGISSGLLGDLQRALEARAEALSIQQAMGDLHGEANTRASLCGIYDDLGDLDNALDCYQQALPVARKIDDRYNEAYALSALGHIYAEMGEPKKALPYLEQALPLHQAASIRRGEAYTLEVIGQVYAELLAEPQKALEYFNRALPLYQAASFAQGDVLIFTDLGSAYSVLGDWEKSLDYLNQAQRGAHAAGDRIREAVALYDMAVAERRAHHLPEALTRVEASLNLIEQLRGSVAGPDFRVSLLATARSRYECLIGVLMDLHRERPSAGYDARALEASERARARGLLDLLSESRADVRQGVEPALLDRARALEKALAGKASRQVQLLAKKHTEEQARTLDKEIAELTANYHEVETEIRARSPHYAALTQPQPLAAGEIQRHVVDKDTILLEYALADEHSYLWVVAPDSLVSYELPGRSEIEAAAKIAYEKLSTGSRPEDAETGKVLRSLSRTLLGQAAARLAHKRVLVVADGALQYLPFGALLSPGGVPLVDQHEIVSLPSASVLATLRREFEARTPAPKMVAILADPVFTRDDPRVSGVAGTAAPQQSDGKLERSAKDAGLLSFERLYSTRGEAERIAALARQDPVLKAVDFEASRATALSPELSQYRIVHIASHGLINSRHPELSGVVLSLVDRQGRSQNGFLQAHEIYNLKLNADLVVLSACQTALGKDVRGEGLIGLTRGFMYAGAPRVVASLWRVPDQATGELMQRFYQGMLRGGLRPAAALREAQLDLRKEKRWSAPYYWAGFILQGEWK